MKMLDKGLSNSHRFPDVVSRLTFSFSSASRESDTLLFFAKCPRLAKPTCVLEGLGIGLTSAPESVAMLRTIFARDVGLSNTTFTL